MLVFNAYVFTAEAERRKVYLFSLRLRASAVMLSLIRKGSAAGGTFYYVNRGSGEAQR